MRSPAPARQIPPPLELLCLNALWSLGEGSVSEVRGIISQKRPLAYTTIMTVLDRLVRKQKVSRRKVGRAFVYQPQVSRDSLRRIALAEFVETYFNGSQEALALFLRNGDFANAPPPERAAEVSAENRL